MKAWPLLLLLAACSSGPVEVSNYCRQVWAVEDFYRTHPPQTADDTAKKVYIEDTANECRQSPGMIAF